MKLSPLWNFSHE